MTSIVKHYRKNADGSLKFVGKETVEVEDPRTKPRFGHVIDNETMQKIGDIAYEGQVNPDDVESYELKVKS